MKIGETVDTCFLIINAKENIHWWQKTQLAIMNVRTETIETDISSLSKTVWSQKVVRNNTLNDIIYGWI